MPKRIKTQPLGVQTLFAPLTAMLNLNYQASVGLHQWYYGTARAYSPDHAITPLIIVPEITVHDPDTKRTYTPTVTSVVWRVIGIDGSYSDYTAQDTAADFSVSPNGTITIRKNFPYTDAPTLQCTVTYRDDRDGTNYTKIETLALSTSLSSEEVYSIQILNNRKWWNPLGSDSPEITFTALARLGEEDVTEHVKFFWYYIHNGAEVLVDDAGDPSLGYVSGQGTATLTVDARYEAEDIEYHVRIASDWTDDGGTEHAASTATAPNVDNVYARATTRWNVGNVKGETFSPNGDTVRNSIEKHRFFVKYRQNGVDIDESIARERIVNSWAMQRVSAAGVPSLTDLGTGEYVEVMDSEMVNGSGYPTTIIAEGSIKSPIRGLSVNIDGTECLVMDGDKLVVGQETD